MGQESISRPLEVAMHDPSGVNNIMAELRSEMAKNSNIVSNSDSWSWVAAMWTDCPARDYGYTVVQEGPGRL
jgi:hypothetical protein